MLALLVAGQSLSTTIRIARDVRLPRLRTPDRLTLGRLEGCSNGNYETEVHP
jgi:hypothetical protein